MSFNALKTAVAAASGLIFGAGLVVSGMTDPARVLAFLDVTGAWNPSLAFVMGGAILVAMPAFAIARRRRTTWFGDPITLPDRFRIDWRLIGGATVFGLGWGITGICPGPGIMLFATLRPEPLLFGAGLIAGIFLTNRLKRGAAVARLANSNNKQEVLF